MSESNETDDDVEVAIIRGPGAKKFLAGLSADGGEDGGDDGDDFDEVEDEDGRTWRSPKQSGKGKLKVKQGGKSSGGGSKQGESFGSRFFSTGTK